MIQPGHGISPAGRVYSCPLLPLASTGFAVRDDLEAGSRRDLGRGIRGKDGTAEGHVERGAILLEVGITGPGYL